jgi:hypothetical protein
MQCKYGAVARGDAAIYLRLPKSKKYPYQVRAHRLCKTIAVGCLYIYRVAVLGIQTMIQIMSIDNEEKIPPYRLHTDNGKDTLINSCALLRGLGRPPRN